MIISNNLLVVKEMSLIIYGFNKGTDEGFYNRTLQNMNWAKNQREQKSLH